MTRRATAFVVLAIAIAVSPLPASSAPAQTVPGDAERVDVAVLDRMLIAPDRAGGLVRAGRVGNPAPIARITSHGSVVELTNRSIEVWGLAVAPSDGAVYFLEGSDIRRVDDQGGDELVVSLPRQPGDEPMYRGLGIDSADNIYTHTSDAVYRVDTAGDVTVFAGTPGQSCSGELLATNDPCGDGNPPTEALVSFEGGIAVSPHGVVAIVQQDRIRMVGLFHDQIATVVGTGVRCPRNELPCAHHPWGHDAQLGMPVDAEWDDHGNLYIAERHGHRVRRFQPDWNIVHVAGRFDSCELGRELPCGVPGPADDISLTGPDAVAPSGQWLYINDNGRLLRVDRPLEVPAPIQHGYRLVAADGGVFNFGWAAHWGSAVDLPRPAPIVGAARIRDGTGYLLAAADGGVFAFGAARNLGSPKAEGQTIPVTGIATVGPLDRYLVLHENGQVRGYGVDRPVSPPTTELGRSVGIASCHDGWWVVTDRGRVVHRDVDVLGDLQSQGIRSAHPIVGIAATNTCGGYWVVASDGGVFSFGEARFHGSTGAMRLNQPIVGIVPTPSGGGYWLIARDGGVFSFGDARFHGSTGAVRLNSPIVGAMLGL